MSVKTVGEYFGIMPEDFSAAIGESRRILCRINTIFARGNPNSQTN
ncbi:hypothetical protein RQN30_08545 [Arcanobacterium hippocoleae]